MAIFQESNLALAGIDGHAISVAQRKREYTLFKAAAAVFVTRALPKSASLSAFYSSSHPRLEIISLRKRKENEQKSCTNESEKRCSKKPRPIESASRMQTQGRGWTHKLEIKSGLSNETHSQCLVIITFPQIASSA